MLNKFFIMELTYEQNKQYKQNTPTTKTKTKPISIVSSNQNINPNINSNINNKEEFEYKLNPKPIGSGSFSTVYLGYDKSNIPVAIKKISIRKLPQDRSINKFEMELDISKSLNNENIVKCYNTFKTNRHWYIVTEYCDSGSLKNLIDSLKTINIGHERENTVKSVMIQLKNALEYLRNINIIHRDLKPMNILFSKKIIGNKELYILKLADFGFARYFNKESIPKNGYDNMIETVCGSPIYMAPELLIDSVFNIKADLWSYGVILYEMLYGNNPYNFPTSLTQLKDCIINKKIKISDGYSTNCILLLKSLLIVDPATRIDWTSFFNHPWFSSSIIHNDEIFDMDEQFESHNVFTSNHFFDVSNKEIVSEDNNNNSNMETVELEKTIASNKIYDHFGRIRTESMNESMALSPEDFVIVRADDMENKEYKIYESYAGSFIRIVSQIVNNYLPKSY